MGIPEWMTTAELIRSLSSNQARITVVNSAEIFGYIPGQMREMRKFIAQLNLPAGRRADIVYERSENHWRPVSVWIRTTLQLDKAYISVLFWRENGDSDMVR